MNDSEKENIKEQYLSPSQTHTVLKQASFISNTEPNISPLHTFRCIKKRMPWSEEEDKTMKQLVNKYGTTNWTLISSKMGKSRNGKQCRERWYNHLNPSLKKNNWTIEEENILFSKHMQLGNKWADIASYLPGRTLNDIKNHFYSKLRKFIRKILKQINDEKLFQINGIDSCKYTGEKIYKMIKKHDITLKNLTKDTIFELIIATEKNPKGKFIFFSDNSGNDFNEFNNIESNPGVIQGNNNNFCNNFFLEDSYENYNLKNNNMINNNGIYNENNNYINLNLTNNNLCNYSFKLKLRKYSNYSDNKSEFNLLNNNNNNIKVIQNKKNKIKNKTKKENPSETKTDNNTDKLLNKKRKKSNKKNSKKTSNIPNKENNVDNPVSKPKKLKKSSKKKNTNKNPEQLMLDNLSRNSLKEMKYLSGNENLSEKNNNNFNFYPPFNILSPKEFKNIHFPLSMTKSNKSIKQEDFSFSNKLLNDYIEPSLQKAQMLPINYDNLSLFQQKNKNNYLMSDLSYDNNLLNMNSKNDNTFRNFSINGNYYNKIMTQNNMNTMNNLSVNNNNMTFKSIDDKMENKKENEKPVLINIDLINHQDFTNAFINGNAIEGNEKSQYNNSVYNKNNNHLNMFNLSSPPSVKNYWK